MERQYFLILLFICLLSLSSCATIAPTPIQQLKYQPVEGTAQNPIKIPCCKKDITLTYLGASGFLIERGNFAVLTAPFFSNPHLLDLYTPIYPNTKRIDNGLAITSLANVKAILVGHAHYDHLMDVPYIVKKIKAQNLPEPKIFGSKTMRNILLNEKRKQREIQAGREVAMDPANIVALNQKAATFWTPGKWVCFNQTATVDCSDQNIIFRFMAINSEHAPHFAGLKFFSGIVESPEEPPATAGADWKEGQTFTYVMDFLGPDKTVNLRIHFQDAASNPPAGFLPVLSPENRIDRVNIAIVCVAGYGEVKNYPEGIMLNLKPRHVILSHWENFFEPYPLFSEKLKVVPGTDVDKFIRRLIRSLSPDTGWTFPTPGSKIIFDPK